MRDGCEMFNQNRGLLELYLATEIRFTAPTGISAAANKAIAQKLEEEGFSFRLANCSAPDDSHSEDSFIVWASSEHESQHLAEVVRELAITYRQNAVFRIDDGHIHVVPVMDLRFHGSKTAEIRISN